ncbi:MAG TPA: hypothetical protein VGK41_01365 [Solirubrobacterales bacterium]
MTKRRELEQYMTPEWVAHELVAQFFPGLSMFDRVLEPSCGSGAFLSAIPAHVPALGVEIDPELAAMAQARTGREVIVGDFAEVDLPQVTAIIGNPPFQLSKVRSFMARALELLPDDGRVGFILPAHTFQTTSTVVDFAERWHMEQVAMPRNVFPGISVPLCFARFTKGRRGLIGFALYHEHHAVNTMQRRYRSLLAQGERSVWAAVTRAALEQLGGEASLPDLYREIEGARPTHNRFWREKVRQQVQLIGVRRGPGRWGLAA